jgi:transcriptional regulator with XRE-family HTH domain
MQVRIKFESNIRTLEAHELGGLMRIWKSVDLTPGQTIRNKTGRELPARKSLLVNVGIGTALCDAIPLAKGLNAHLPDVVSKCHGQEFYPNGVDTQDVLRIPYDDLRAYRYPIHNLRMVHSDTTINRAVRRVAGGARIKAAREKAGISRSELAKRLDMPYPSLASIEQGARGVTFDLAAKLSEIFDVAGEWFMGEMGRQEALLIGTSRGHRGFIHEPPPTHRPVQMGRQKAYKAKS